MHSRARFFCAQAIWKILGGDARAYCDLHARLHSAGARDAHFDRAARDRQGFGVLNTRAKTCQVRTAAPATKTVMAPAAARVLAFTGTILMRGARARLTQIKSSDFAPQRRSLEKS